MSIVVRSTRKLAFVVAIVWLMFASIGSPLAITDLHLTPPAAMASGTGNCC